MISADSRQRKLMWTMLRIYHICCKLGRWRYRKTKFQAIYIWFFHNFNFFSLKLLSIFSCISETSAPVKESHHLKHTTTLFSLTDHYILSRNGELLLIKYKSIIMVGLWCYSQSGVVELFIVRDPHCGRMCFKSVKTSELYILSCRKVHS